MKKMVWAVAVMMVCGTMVANAQDPVKPAKQQTESTTAPAQEQPASEEAQAEEPKAEAPANETPSTETPANETPQEETPAQAAE